MKKPFDSCGVWLSALACVSWLIPAQISAAEAKQIAGLTPAMRPIILDIALGPQGRMTGQLVNAQGKAQANQPVVVHRQGAASQSTQTDQNGRFQFNGMSGGTYQVATTNAATICRCWADKTAPPAARQDVLLVSGDGIQRGQYPFSEMLFSAPVLIALVIAAAIAIPIAVHNSQDDAS